MSSSREARASGVRSAEEQGGGPSGKQEAGGLGAFQQEQFWQSGEDDCEVGGCSGNLRRQESETMSRFIYFEEFCCKRNREVG